MARPKGKNKEKVGFSIDKKTLQELDSFCECNSMNRSKLVNKIVKEYLEKNYEMEWLNK